MVPVRTGLVVALATLGVLLVVLVAGHGVGIVGVATASACGLVLGAAVRRSAASYGVTALGPADLVTLTRATMTCGVAALVSDVYAGGAASPTLVTLATIALVLDAVDGRVARRTGTSTAFGARGDGEADAFWMLVLSVHVAGTHGVWVLAIGGYRYLFAAAGWALPWMRARLPGRYWRKVVTAVAGTSLLLATAGVADPVVERLALAVTLLLLTESFGRDVRWLWRARHHLAAPAVAPSQVPAG